MTKHKFFLGLAGLILAGGQAYDKYVADTVIFDGEPTFLFYAYLIAALISAYFVFIGLRGWNK